jgi:hypothetical protein
LDVGLDAMGVISKTENSFAGDVIMKLYRTQCGAWINLSLCTRFYIKEDHRSYSVKAVIDISDIEQIDFYLLEGLSFEKEAQAKLDEIMSSIK